MQNTGTHTPVPSLNPDHKLRHAINFTRHQRELLGCTVHLSLMSTLSSFNLCLTCAAAAATAAVCVCVCVCRRVCQQLSESKELCTRLQDLEKELSTRLTSMEEGKQQLQEQCTDAQAKINSLSQVCTACVCVCVRVRVCETW